MRLDILYFVDYDIDEELLGHTQCIDSVPIKANTSMDSLELKVLESDLESHLITKRLKPILHKKRSL